MECLDVEVEGPPAPDDAMPELCFLPANWGVDGGDKEDKKHDLILPGSLCEHSQQIVHVEPCFMAVLLQQCMCNAEELASDALPPISAEFGTEMADCAVV